MYRSTAGGTLPTIERPPLMSFRMVLADTSGVRSWHRITRSPSRPAARARDHHDRRQPTNLVGLVPCAEQPGRVPPQDEEQLRSGIERVQVGKRVRRERHARAPQLEVRNSEARLVRGGQAGHLEPVLRARGRRGPMGRLAAGHEEDAVEARAFDRRLRGRNVSDVDGIERPTQHPDSSIHRAQGWYSNSMPPMRSVSPGSPPAPSRASLTPRRSSSVWNRSSEPSESRLVCSTRCSTRPPWTSNPQAIRSTTRLVPVTGSLIVAGRAGVLGSGAVAIALTIAFLSSGKPAPVSADTK